MDLYGDFESHNCPSAVTRKTRLKFHFEVEGKQHSGSGPSGPLRASLKPVLDLSWAYTAPILHLWWADAGPRLTPILGVYCACTGPVLGIDWTSTRLPLDLYWPPTGRLLLLYWTCTGPRLDFYWTSTGPLLTPYWTSTVPVVDLDWASAGPLLDFHWTSTGPRLGVYCACTGPGPRLDLYWTSTGPPATGRLLRLCWDYHGRLRPQGATSLEEYQGRNRTAYSNPWKPLALKTINGFDPNGPLLLVGFCSTAAGLLLVLYWALPYIQEL